jgi:rod shape determining protein RodA
MWISIDWFTIVLYLVLVVAGWFSIYASSYDFDQVSIFDISGRAGMQMLWILISSVVGFSLLLIESDWYDIFAYWIYFFVMLLLILTILMPHDIRGSSSWLIIGPVRLQPAEFAKFATALAVARIMNGYKFDLMNTKNLLLTLALIAFPMGLIFLQKETGSALVFLAFFLVLYRDGMPGSILFNGFCAILFFVISIKFVDTTIGEETPLGTFMALLLIVVFLNIMLFDFKKGKQYTKYVAGGSAVAIAGGFIVSLFYPINLCIVVLSVLFITLLFMVFNYIKFKIFKFLYIAIFAFSFTAYVYSIDYVFDNMMKPYQQTRIKVALGVIDDPRNAGYNVNQSKIAIGSGGVLGKGYLNGTQTKLKFVPEQDTDFIFCTIGEEEGFLGTALVLLLFSVLIIRLIYLAERQKTVFNRVYGYSVASIIFFHITINIGMVTGLTPVIGIPLPFFSYGGSSILAFTVLLFIFLRLDAARNDRL